MLKTVAKNAENQSRRELEQGFKNQAGERMWTNLLSNDQLA